MNVEAPVRLALIAKNKVIRSVKALSRDVSLAGIGLCQAQGFAERKISYLTAVREATNRDRLRRDVLPAARG